MRHNGRRKVQVHCRAPTLTCTGRMPVAFALPTIQHLHITGRCHSGVAAARPAVGLWRWWRWLEMRAAAGGKGRPQLASLAPTSPHARAALDLQQRDPGVLAGSGHMLRRKGMQWMITLLHCEQPPLRSPRSSLAAVHAQRQYMYPRLAHTAVKSAMPTLSRSRANRYTNASPLARKRSADSAARRAAGRQQ